MQAPETLKNKHKKSSLGWYKHESTKRWFSRLLRHLARKRSRLILI